MALAVAYTNFGGLLLHEKRGNDTNAYVPDSLGSLAALTNGGKAAYEAEYWPYGEVRTETGTNPSPWSFGGLLGYFKDLLSKLLYVRARHYTPDRSQWLVEDAFWPTEQAYVYCEGSPAQFSDPLGAKPADCKRLIDTFFLIQRGCCQTLHLDCTKYGWPEDCIELGQKCLRILDSWYRQSIDQCERGSHERIFLTRPCEMLSAMRKRYSTLGCEAQVTGT